MVLSSRVHNLIGKEFGNWTVIDFGERCKLNRIQWLCKCKCGAIKNVAATSLKNGDSRSCGCHKREVAANRFSENRKNKIGRKYGRLTITSINSVGSPTKYDCLCDCGNTSVVAGPNLVTGAVQSCGCLNSEVAKRRNDNFRETLLGKKFGRLEVISFDGVKNRFSHFECRCDCGNVVSVAGINLNSGNTQSCGCYMKEVVSDKFKTHGLSKHPLYGIWGSIIQRCTNPKISNYEYYGGSGIKICNEWRANFEAFYYWAIANGYQEGLEIDRFPDRNGNYEPTNCRWTTKEEQSRNRDIVKLSLEEAIEIRKDNRTQTEIARDYGVSQGTVSSIKRNKIWKEP